MVWVWSFLKADDRNPIADKVPRAMTAAPVGERRVGAASEIRSRDRADAADVDDVE